MADNHNTQLTVMSNRPELGGIVPILLEHTEYANPDSTSAGTRVSQLCTLALASQRVEKYMFVELSQYFL